MKSHEGYIVDITHRTIREKTIIQIFGRLENGKSFCILEEFRPYFYIKSQDSKKASLLLKNYSVDSTNLTNFRKEKITKISADTQSELSKLSSALHKKDIETYESDINPSRKFLIDNNLLGSIEITGESEPSEKVDLLFKNPKIQPSNFKPNLKILSLDIESDKNHDKLYCIGLYSRNYKKNFLVTSKKTKIANTVNCKTEQEALQKFKDELIKQDPDIITGWHVIEFDIDYLRKKFQEHKIPFDIGRTNENPRLKIEKDFLKPSTATIPGRQALDALTLIKDPFIKEAPSIKSKKFETYKLEDVSREILGEGKTIKNTGKSKYKEIDEAYKRNPGKLVEYNIQDCKLVYDILEKTRMIDLAIERTMLTGLPLNRLTATIAAFDSLYIREAKKRGLVSPSTDFKERHERILGGYVMDSEPGIYHNVLVLDFKSLYPSIIKTFNIDPSSLLDKKEKDSIESPNKAYFKNQEGILPEIITKLHKAREKAKKESRELSSYAIKIIMNSFFGALASPNCRYYSLKMGNAITHFAQKIIKLTAEKVEKKGYKVIYSDTDSIFIDTNLGYEKANLLGKEIQNYINKFFKEYVKKEYHRESYLELEFEKQYLSFLLPKVRGSESASKKRYAGLIKKGKEKIEIVGLEAIRGDWTDAAQEFQIKLLEKIFRKEEFVQFIRDYVKDLESGKFDDKLVYRKSLRKALSAYTKTTPPHVKAARQLDVLDSNIVEYYITIKGPEPIQKKKHQIDYKHYIKKQIEPIANTILFFFHKDFKEILESSKQMKLF